MHEAFRAPLRKSAGAELPLDGNSITGDPRTWSAQRTLPASPLRSSAEAVAMPGELLGRLEGMLSQIEGDISEDFQLHNASDCELRQRQEVARVHLGQLVELRRIISDGRVGGGYDLKGLANERALQLELSQLARQHGELRDSHLAHKMEQKETVKRLKSVAKLARMEANNAFIAESEVATRLYNEEAQVKRLWNELGDIERSMSDSNKQQQQQQHQQQHREDALQVVVLQAECDEFRRAESDFARRYDDLRERDALREETFLELKHEQIADQEAYNHCMFRLEQSTVQVVDAQREQAAKFEAALEEVQRRHHIACENERTKFYTEEARTRGLKAEVAALEEQLVVSRLELAEMQGLRIELQMAQALHKAHDDQNVSQLTRNALLEEQLSRAIAASDLHARRHQDYKDETSVLESHVHMLRTENRQREIESNASLEKAREQEERRLVEISELQWQNARYMEKAMNLERDVAMHEQSETFLQQHLYSLEEAQSMGPSAHNDYLTGLAHTKQEQIEELKTALSDSEAFRIQQTVAQSQIIQDLQSQIRAQSQVTAQSKIILEDNERLQEELVKLRGMNESQHIRKGELETELWGMKELEDLRGIAAKSSTRLGRHSFDSFGRPERSVVDLGARRGTWHDFSLNGLEKHNSLLSVPKRRTSFLQEKLRSSPAAMKDIEMLLPEGAVTELERISGHIRRSGDYIGNGEMHSILEKAHDHGSTEHQVVEQTSSGGSSSGSSSVSGDQRQDKITASTRTLEGNTNHGTFENEDGLLEKSPTAGAMADMLDQRPPIKGVSSTHPEEEYPVPNNAWSDDASRFIDITNASRPGLAEDREFSEQQMASRASVHSDQADIVSNQSPLGDQADVGPIKSSPKAIDSNRSHGSYITQRSSTESLQDPASVIDRIEQVGWSNLSWMDGFTPLHWAAQNEKPDLIALLLSNRADPNEKDDENKTAWDYASPHGRSLLALRRESLGAILPNAAKNCWTSEHEKASFPQLLPKSPDRKMEVLLHEPGSIEPTRLSTSVVHSETSNFYIKQGDSESSDEEDVSSEDEESEEVSDSEDSEIYTPPVLARVNSLHPSSAQRSSFH